MTQVVNIKRFPYDVYIGRPGRGEEGFFGNSHPIGWCDICNQHHNRDESVVAFKKEFLYRIENDMGFRKRVIELKDKVLGCFCKPLPCHGDIIANWLDNQPNLL